MLFDIQAHRARVIKIQDGHEKTCDLRFGVEQVRLPGRGEMLDWW